MKPALLGGLAIGLALTYFIGYHGLYARQRERVQKIQAQVTQEQADRKAKEEVAALLRQIDLYREQLSPTADTSWLVREAVELGHKAGVELKNLSQDSPEKFDQFTRLSVHLRFTATYHQLGTFLDYLERAGHFLRVDHLDLTVPEEERSPASIELVLSTLYLEPANGAAGIPMSRRD